VRVGSDVQVHIRTVGPGAPSTEIQAFPKVDPVAAEARATLVVVEMEELVPEAEANTGRDRLASAEVKAQLAPQGEGATITIR